MASSGPLTSSDVPYASAPRPLPLSLLLAPLPLGNDPEMAVGSGVDEEVEREEDTGAEDEP